MLHKISILSFNSIRSQLLFLPERLLAFRADVRFRLGPLLVVPELLLNVFPIFVADGVVVVRQRVAQLVNLPCISLGIVVAVRLVHSHGFLRVHVDQEGQQVRRPVAGVVQVFGECLDVRELSRRVVTVLDESFEEVPRAFVVLNQPNAVHGVVDFPLNGFRRQAEVLEDEEALVPGRVVAHVHR